jgi:hypothetical protein
MIEGLARTMAMIDEKTRAIKGDYIVELKQNYATPYLHGYGTMVRAGDTPYNSEGNFLRTAFVNAYTPYSLNDYQTITNSDSPEAAACLIVKMLAVGIPAYSINFTVLHEHHKKAIAFYHAWYRRRLPGIACQRTPQDGRLNGWLASLADEDVYFLLNDDNRVSLRRKRPCQILNGTFRRELQILLPGAATVAISAASPNGERPVATPAVPVERLTVAARPGDILTVSMA